MSVTARLRAIYAGLFVLAVLASIFGWFLGLDPSELAPLLGTLAVAVGIGEASNIGKRATFKTEIAEYHDASS